MTKAGLRNAGLEVMSRVLAINGWSVQRHGRCAGKKLCPAEIVGRTTISALPSKRQFNTVRTVESGACVTMASVLTKFVESD